MFISVKRHEREKQELIGANNRFTDAVLKHANQGLFLLDSKDNVLLPVSHTLSLQFRRHDFTNLTFEKLLAPLVTAKTLTMVRNYIAALLKGDQQNSETGNPLNDVPVRLPTPQGTSEAAHYSFEFDPVVLPDEPRAWLVRVTDITVPVTATRELEELRAQVELQGEMLRGVLQMGGARFGAFMQKTDAAMKTIGTVLKKPAREQTAFRLKLEETLNEVDRVRREAAAFKLSGLERTARVFEDALQDLRSRSELSGSDFLPLAVKLDQLYEQFASLKSLTIAAGPAREPEAAANAPPVTETGTQIISAPKFTLDMLEPKTTARPYRTARTGSLDSTLQALTDHVAQEQNKQVVLEASGLELIPPRYQTAIKNIAIQLIRNAVMHGIEAPEARAAANKAVRGTLRLDFKSRRDTFDLLFEDDGRGLNPDEVRATAVERGVVTSETAARLRDREAIKLIFKSRYTTLANSPSDVAHGAGMSLVRRYVHDAGGKIALASLPGHETRFKVTFPAAADSDLSSSVDTPSAAEA
jgi:two-component system chemotaxis sensor kinase CheA